MVPNLDAQVYLEEADKPAVGEGLNKGAEVTLHKVWRMDKATNRPTTDPEAISRFERKLKKLAAEQSARFLSYSADSGTWVFEVDHFSRRALPCCRVAFEELHAKTTCRAASTRAALSQALLPARSIPMGTHYRGTHHQAKRQHMLSVRCVLGTGMA